MPESTALGSRFRPPAGPAFGIAALIHTLPAAFAYYVRIALPLPAGCLDRSQERFSCVGCQLALPSGESPRFRARVVLPTGHGRLRFSTCRRAPVTKPTMPSNAAVRSLLVDSSTFFLQTRGGVSRIAAKAIESLLGDFDVTLTYGLEGAKNQFASNLRNLPYLWKGSEFSFFRPWFRVPEEFDLVLIPYLGIPVGGRAYRMLICHDLIREATEPVYRRLPHSMVKWMTIRASNHVLPVSDCTKAALTRRWPHALQFSRVTTLRNAIEELPEAAPAVHSRRKNSVLYVGLRTGYKNFAACISVLREQADLLLDVVGRELSAGELAKWGDVAKRVTVHQGVSEQELSRLYRTAGCLLFPSEIEGFGLPILESLSVGTPVVALDRAYSRELASLVGEGLYLAPDDKVTEWVLKAISTDSLPPRNIRDWSVWRAEFLAAATPSAGWKRRLGQSSREGEA